MCTSPAGANLGKPKANPYSTHLAANPADEMSDYEYSYPARTASLPRLLLVQGLIEQKRTNNKRKGTATSHLWS